MKKPEPLNFDEGVILFIITYEMLALSTLMCPWLHGIVWGC